MNKLKCFFGFHNFSNSKKMVFGENGFWEMDWNPVIDQFSIFTVIESRYKCLDCGRYYWYPSDEFNRRIVEDTIHQLLKPSK